MTNIKRPVDLLVWFYNQRAGAENLIKEANNDAGLVAHPSGRWAINCVHFQLAMLAYNLNCWLLLFQREETAKVVELKHTTLAIARLRFLFLAAKVWRHAGRVGVSYRWRSVRGAGLVPAPHGSLAQHRSGRGELCARVTHSPTIVNRA